MGINDAMETDETRLPDNELQAKADSFDRVYDYTRDRSEKNENKK
jgi:hypothetical protein